MGDDRAHRQWLPSQNARAGHRGRTINWVSYRLRKEEKIALNLPERLFIEASGRLPEVVRVALKDPRAVLGEWDAVSVPLRGGAGALGVGRSLFKLRGLAWVGPVERPWSIVLKVLAPVAGHDGATNVEYWKRESLLYCSGFLDDLSEGVRAPRCYGIDEMPDGTVYHWLEHVREDGGHIWPLTRWALAARHLGQFNGAYLTGRPLPRAPWLGGRRLRSWLERHQPLVKQIATAPLNPQVRKWWPQPVVNAILHLWDQRDEFCTALERLPQTFCHGDAIRRNLFSRYGVDGSEETVAIDWEHAGHYAVGEEVGQTLSVASAFFDVEPADLPSLDEALFASYLKGLRDAGWHGEPRQVRFAYAAHAALRNAFNAVGASVPDETRRASAQLTYGHTWEDLAERRAAIRPFLLNRAIEARRLHETL